MGSTFHKKFLDVNRVLHHVKRMYWLWNPPSCVVLCCFWPSALSLKFLKQVQYLMCIRILGGQQSALGGVSVYGMCLSMVFELHFESLEAVLNVSLHFATALVAVLGGDEVFWL